MKTSTDAQVELERIVDAVADSYGQGRIIDSLESTALPNERKIVDALACLQHVIYMGFYSTRVLTPVNLRHHIGEHLHNAFDGLLEQIARAVVYQRQRGGTPAQQDIDFSASVLTDMFSCIPRLRESMSMDVEATYAADPSAKAIEEVVFSYPGIRALTTFRIAHELYLRKVPMVPRIMTEHAHRQTGIDIHPGAKIGRRFFIDHGTGVVIGETAEIGDDVKIYQGVTLGALSLPRDGVGDLIRDAKRHPTIENGVTLYAGATVLGGDTVIGEGSVVGANVWLTRSIPPNTRVTYSQSGGSRDDHRFEPTDSERTTARDASPFDTLSGRRAPTR